MPAIAAVVFDLDGTLVDTRSAVAQAHNASFTAFDPVDHLLGRVPRGADLAVYHRRLGELAEGLRTYEGVPELLDQLAVPLGIVTGASRESCEIVLGATGLRGLFDVVVTADDVVKPKPDSEGLRLACERLELEPTSVAYVGDLTGDVAAARACGAVSVGAAWGGHAAVAGADHVLRRPGELLELLRR